MPTYTVRDGPSPEVEKELEVHPPLLRQLLCARGITNRETAHNFLNPDYEKHSHDPFLMKDMERSVTRILKAMEGNERIAIYSDYDADGIPGAVALHDFFKKIGFHNFVNYIPDRHTEGFGLNAKALEELAGDEVTLLITIDCGITDLEEVEYACARGIEVIITDHHLPRQSPRSPNGGGSASVDDLPSAFAILNPKQAECSYPEKMLCGAGVVFKLIQALCKRLRSDLEIGNWKLEIPKAIFATEWERWLLDVIGIATLSDMVPLVGENRTLAYFGLKVLRKSPRAGLLELLSELRVKQVELSEDDIGFSVTPRINAASRMGQPHDAFALFTTRDREEAGTLARHLNRINDARKGRVASLVREVRKVVSEREERTVIVAGNPEWRPALLGLVANTLAEDLQRPVFLWGREASVELKGSCRSGGSVDLSLLMREAQSVFLDFGGHKEAGGFSTTLEKVHLLEAELERAYEKVRTEYQPATDTPIDAILSLEDVRMETWREIERLAPFGVGNPKPVFLFKNVEVKKAEQFGKEKQHLKLMFEKTNGEKISAIRFYASLDSFAKRPEEKTEVTLIAHLERSTFGNRAELRLRIVDVV